MLIKLAFTFSYALILLFFLRKVAKKIGLVDKPHGRKQHKGDIPLVGGIAIFITVSELIYSYPTLFRNAELYLVLAFVLVFIGALDDRFNINYRYRIVIQIIIAIVMVRVGNLKLENIGDILFIGNIHLGSFGWIITILGVLGAINAFNMVDGIDGLLGILSSVTFGGLFILLMLDHNYDLAFFCVALIVMIFPYILFNMGAFGRKRQVFMGDAGSMLIGYTIIWLLFLSSQESLTRAFRPVTGLWLIAIPLMDMVTIMIRRVLKKQSPFQADREHLHHMFQQMGFNSWQTLLIITMLSIVLAGIGILGELYKVRESFMFSGFIIIWVGYYVLMTLSWRIVDCDSFKNH